jgi:hypothetical protein
LESRNASRDTSARFDQYAGLIGKPYAHGADGPDAYDCFGACVKAVEIFYGYPVLPPRCTQDYAMNYCGWVEVSNAQQFTGDLILTYGNEGDHLWFRARRSRVVALSWSATGRSQGVR